ncbi:C45 family autoproteolytic acyltransferase/hydolase [Alkalibacillus almallahensis]|uniref:C45 family autoproteolytic acyltransferase/hydolase n=1 Tax=Alkalibacillus almallahensis TaxID=1379154 RepID=UPI001421EAAC|nr:C45 family peptidase [Alkalibacillus almallahensis]NIK12596.1 putative choloylglycine hydrolase [Alkalibacillus almallahensis]
MGNFKISLEQYRGASYDIGYGQGLQIDRSLLTMFSNVVSEEDIDLDELKKVYSLHAPHLLHELAGIADSMNISLCQAAIFSGFSAPEIQGMGYSSVVNANMLVRNYDFSPEIYDGRLVLVQPDEGFASVGHSLHVTGRTEGVNEHGLAVALHFVNSEDTQTGFTAASVIRIILDTCKNTEEAVDVIKQLPHSWSYNYSIGDSEGNVVVVEESPFDIKTRKDQHTLCCTNHFQREDMTQLNRDHVEDSEERLDYLHRDDFKRMDGLEVFNKFRSEGTHLYNEDYLEYFGTLHTFAYLFDEKKVYTAIPGGEALEIDFSEWVKGEDLEQTELTGHLNI